MRPAEPLLQLVGTVLQVDVVMLSVVSGDQFLTMRGGKLESQSATEASPLKRALHPLVTADTCSTVVISDTALDARCVPASFYIDLLKGYFSLHTGSIMPLVARMCRVRETWVAG